MTTQPIVENRTLTLSNISNEIYEIIPIIRPDWNASNTRLVTFTEGITNSILGLFNTRTPDDESDALVIKLFGEHTELFIDRNAEIHAMMKLSENNVLSQRVLIQFKNGLVYEFAAGRACSKQEVRDEHISKLIAAKLAQFHNVPLKETNEEPYVITLIHKFIQLIDEHQITDISQIKSDMKTIEKVILPDLVPNPQIGQDLVFCHNDLLIKNIVYDKKTDTVSFIDFEYTHMNYALFDIANHFVEYAGVDDADFNLYPTRDEQKRWLKTYFQTRGMPEQTIDDKLCHLVDQFSALAHLMWGLWSLVQSRVSLLDFDYTGYGKLRLGCYQNLRKILFENVKQ